MARNRFDNLEPDKQEAILQAAGEEFVKKGFTGASINRIIKASGMSKGSVYYYFEDKADLFATTLERSLQRLLDEIGWFSLEVLGPDEFWDALLELTRRSVAWARKDEWWVRLAFVHHKLEMEPGTEKAAGRLMEFGHRWWKSILERGQALELIRTDLPIDLLVAIVIGADRGGDQWMVDHWEVLGEEETLKIADARVDLLRDMLAKENEGWER